MSNGFDSDDQERTTDDSFRDDERMLVELAERDHQGGRWHGITISGSLESVHVCVCNNHLLFGHSALRQFQYAGTGQV